MAYYPKTDRNYLCITFMTTLLDAYNEGDMFVVITTAGEYSTIARNNEFRDATISHIGKRVKLTVAIKTENGKEYYSRTELV